jgi:hypothetical protein
MMKRVAKTEMIFVWQWRVGVRQSGKGGRRWWCRFNASILAREVRRRNKALSEDKVEAASSSWLHGKEA